MHRKEFRHFPMPEGVKDRIVGPNEGAVRPGWWDELPYEGEHWAGIIKRLDSLLENGEGTVGPKQVPIIEEADLGPKDAPLTSVKAFMLPKTFQWVRVYDDAPERGGKALATLYLATEQDGRITLSTAQPRRGFSPNPFDSRYPLLAARHISQELKPILADRTGVYWNYHRNEPINYGDYIPREYAEAGRRPHFKGLRREPAIHPKDLPKSYNERELGWLWNMDVKWQFPNFAARESKLAPVLQTFRNWGQQRVTVAMIREGLQRA